MMLVYVVLAIILCVFLSSFFSSSEMAISSCNRIRIDNAKDDGNKKAKVASKLLSKFDDVLSTILVGNNLVNIAASSLGTVSIILIFDGKSDSYQWISTLVITILIIIFGETMPKIAAEKNANRYILSFAGILRFLVIIFKPVTWVVVSIVNLITRPLKGEKNSENDDAVEELQTIIDTAQNEDVIDENESELVKTAISFADISAYEVMTARVDMVAIDVDADWEEIIETIDSSTYSRLPVYEGSADKIIGMLSLNHFLKAYVDNKKVDIRSLLLPALFVYKTTKLPNVFAMFKNAKQHLAIVTDEYGGTLGVISMEDVLEQIVGNIWDDTDQIEPEVIEHKNGEFELDGDMPISDFLEITGWPEDTFDADSETLGGWVIEKLERFPVEGDSFNFRNANISVTEIDEHRVVKVLVKINRSASEDA